MREALLYSALCPAVAECKAELLAMIKTGDKAAAQAASQRYMTAIRERNAAMRKPATAPTTER